MSRVNLPAEFHDIADAIQRDPDVPGDVRATVLGLYSVGRYLEGREFYQDDDGVTHVRVAPDEPEPVAQEPTPVPAQEPTPPVAPTPTPSPATPPAPPEPDPAVPAETPADVTPADVTPVADADADADNGADKTDTVKGKGK